MPDRARRALGLVAAAIVVACVMLDASPLTTALALTPMIALAWFPRASARRWLAIVVVSLAGLAGGSAPIVDALVLNAGRADRVLPWWPLVIKGWCVAGLGLMCGVSIARVLSGERRFRAAFIALITIAVVAESAVPLKMLYRQQRTWRELPYPDGTRLTVFAPESVALDGILLPAETVDPHGLVVFTHGVQAWKEYYGTHLRFFREHGWAVLAYDLRGHGRSSAAAVTYGVREADDLVAVWKQASELAGGKPLIAFGASMGGSIVLLAAHRLEPCAGVVSENAYAELAPLVERSLAAPFRWIAAAELAAADGALPQRIRPVDSPILRQGAPLCIAWTQADETVPPEHGLELANAAPRAQTYVDSAASHNRMMDSDGWRLVLGDFLETCRARAEQHPGSADGSGAATR
jgi:uncharacterized protein